VSKFEVTAVHITAAVQAMCRQHQVIGARRFETMRLSQNVVNRLPDVATPKKKCKEILSFKFVFFYVLSARNTFVPGFVALR
jgi:Na+/H+ antiporter NhaB